MYHNYALYVDETRPRPEGEEQFFAVNAAILGSSHSFKRIKRVVPRNRSEIKWSRASGANEASHAIRAVFNSLKEGKKRKAGKLRVMFTFASRSDFNPDQIKYVDRLAKVMIGKTFLEQLNAVNSDVRLKYTIDGSLDSVLPRAYKDYLKFLATGLNLQEGLRIVGSRKARSRVKFMTDHMAGAFHQHLEEKFGRYKTSGSSSTNKAVLEKRAQIHETLLTGLKTVSYIDYRTDDLEDFTSSCCANFVNKSAHISEWPDIPSVQVIRLQPKHFRL